MPAFQKDGNFFSYGNAFEIDTGKIVAGAVRRTNRQAASIISNAFEDAIVGNIRGSLSLENEIKNFHRGLAKKTTDNMIRYYQDGKSGRESYRQLDGEKWRKRYSGKKMEKGLKTVVRTTPTGIALNFDELTRYAKQWTRLNFGTDPAGSPNVRTSKLQIFNQKVSNGPTLETFGPLRAFALPDGGGMALRSDKAFKKTPPMKLIRQAKGSSGIGGDYWYIYGTKNKVAQKVTKGIRGWRFIDRAINDMNKEWNREIPNIVRNWVKRVEQDFRSKAEVRQNIEVPEVPEIRRKFPTRSAQARAQRRSRGGRFVAGFKNNPTGYWVFE